MNKVKSICLTSNDGSDIYYDEVGKNGITNIKAIEYSPEPHCQRFIFEVYHGDKLAWERHQVTTVYYL